MDIKNIIGQLTLMEKVILCFGGSYWQTASIPRFNIPSITMIDGPSGINKPELSMDKELTVKGSSKSICYPSSCCTCCSFDRDLLFKLGETFGDEMIKEGISILLGPGVNIKRSPLCGRNFNRKVLDHASNTLQQTTKKRNGSHIQLTLMNDHFTKFISLHLKEPSKNQDHGLLWHHTTASMAFFHQLTMIC